ncbi:hypothetical protein [Streptomyces rochei]|uniref:hypothetical protein n=1 Tax=Streptomyces rochei TaxID=1928 RepID=UPI0036A86348
MVRCNSSAMYASRPYSTADPYVFQVLGDDAGGAGFSERWICTLREQTAAG